MTAVVLAVAPLAIVLGALYWVSCGNFFLSRSKNPGYIFSK